MARNRHVRGLAVPRCRFPVPDVAASHPPSRKALRRAGEPRATSHGHTGATFLELLVVLLVIFVLLALSLVAVYRAHGRAKANLADQFKKANERLMKE